jgi:ribonucleotide reductase class II
MVRELNRPQASHAFPDNAPTAYPVFYRTYSRRTPQGDRETWPQVCARSLAGLVKLGKLTDPEADLIRRMQDKLWALPSGRWLWVGGTPWLENPDNFSGAYNCTSTNVSDWRAFGLMMDLAMMGCGTGAVLEPDYISQLPPIRNALQVTMDGDLGSVPAGDRRQETTVEILANRVRVVVGDSRQGWVKSYQTLLDLSCDDRFEGEVHVAIDLSNVRPAGETLQGFGGVANPVKLPELYDRVIRILNRAIGRQLTSVECCLLIDEAAVTIVAGNIRRCIAHGERVAAISGMKPIQDIAIGELVLTSSGDYRPVTGKFLQGVQEVVEIRTRETSIRCTANHRVAVYSGLRSYAWKYAGELQPGDRLISVPHRKGMPCATADYAWLVGFFIGDGHADVESSKRRNGGGGCVAFAFSQERLNGPLGQKCLRILKGLGYTPALSFQKNYAHIKVYRKDLANELGQYKQPWQTPIIPEFAWLGTEEIRAAFLAGLADADASPSRNVLLNSNKIEFLRRVQQLALSLGIATTLHERQPKTLPGRDTVYEGCHGLKIRGIQSQVNAVALVNPHMGRTGFWICGQKKNGLSLPHQFLQEAMAEGWRARTVNTTKSIISPSKKDGPIRDANWDTLLAEDVVNPHWLPLEVQLVVPAGQAETFDIEVESDHEFIASGLLVHNSAGMRQFASEDALGATAKDNLWQQDDQGNWRIDPDRDSLRMANHSRVFHHKPTEEECVAAVRKQFYSGEGAIQWAGEAIARSNGDLVPPERKGEFIAAYAAGQGREWLKAADPSQGDRELDHRLGRYGLNPCVTADTWVHTEFGPRQVRDLIGRQHGTYVNGELFSTTEDGFFQTGVQPVLKVTTREGVSLRLTGNHRLLKVTSQTQKRQYTEWTATEALQPGDRLCLHNHRDITPWHGAGTFAEGWLLGSLVGDGSLAQTAWRDQGILRFWGDTQVEMAAHAIATLRETVVHGGNLAGHYHPQHDLHQVSSSGLGALAAQFGIHRGQKWVSPEVEQSSYDCHRGFLRGLFDADGSVQGHHGKGISVRLAQSSLVTLEAVQRMLLRLGIAARIYKNRRPAGMRMLPNTERTLAPYFCQAQHELVIANDSLLVFRDRVGFQQPDKRDKLNGLLDGYRRNLNRDRFTVTVQAIESDGVEPVYDCTVPGPSRFDANGLVAHNCGEILGEDFHCVSGETMLVTRTGMAPIASLVGQVVEVWNGQRWSAVTPIQTGSDRALYRVRFGDGTYLDVTEGHRFFVKDRFGKVYEERTTAELIEQLPSLKYALHTEPFQMDYRDGKAINPIWAYTLGQLVGDGSLCQSNGKPQLQLRLYGAETYKKELAIAGRTSGKPKFYAENPETPCLLYTGFHREFDPDQVRDLKQMAEPFEAIATWNREAILHFIAGLIDADGSSVASGGVRLYLSGYDRAYRVYLLLLKCGIRSSVNLLATAGTRTNLGVRSKDLWYLQITDARAIPCQRVDTSNGHAPKSKGKWQVIRSIEPIAGRHDTFCFNEPEFHKGVFGGTLTGQCNLSEIHLNQIDPTDRTAQRDAFTAGGLAVASLLNHRFQEERYRYSREVDPIVGVSFTGLFDFFVQAFGVEWLKWWEAGRPETPESLEFKDRERDYLTFWRETVHQTVWDYCDRHGLRRPNRCTTVQPSGTKSLLTGASPGWHPPKAARFIRRITFRKNDPVALACMDYGYSIVPSQSDKDETGNLLTDPFDPRCTEWLVEIPVAVSWADLPGADTIAIEHFSALAQFDFYMQVQRHYTAHNTSATIELREDEIEALGQAIHGAIARDEGYISAALLARFDAPFPRLPFEKIDRETYDRLHGEMLARRRVEDFTSALKRYDRGEMEEAGPAGCDSDKCLLPEVPPA